MSAWARPDSILPPGPAGPVWSPPAPAAGLDGFPADPVAGVVGRLVAVARERAAGRFQLVTGDDPAEAAPGATEGVPVAYLSFRPLPPVPVCVSADGAGTSYRQAIHLEIAATVPTADPTASAAFWPTLLRAFLPLAPELVADGVTLARPVATGWGGPAADGGPRCEGVGALELWTYFDLPWEDEANP